MGSGPEFEPFLNNYFCGKAVSYFPAESEEITTNPKCIDFGAGLAFRPYEAVKAAQLALMKYLSDPNEYPFATNDIGMETAVIAWLISRELGREHIPDSYMESLFQEDFYVIKSADRIKAADKDHILSGETRDGMAARTSFWLSKSALILITDLDNPRSQKYLRLTYKQDGNPVFGVSLPPSKDPQGYSNEEKLRLLRQVYSGYVDRAKIPAAEFAKVKDLFDNSDDPAERFLVFKPGIKNVEITDLPVSAELAKILLQAHNGTIEQLGDPLLETECLMAQYELRVSRGSLKPSQSINIVKDKLARVLEEVGPVVDRTRRFTGIAKFPSYIQGRISDQGYNSRLGSTNPYWSGQQLRFREGARYLAQAKRFQAQFLLMETRFTNPAFESQMKVALKLLDESEKLIADYGDEPAKLGEGLTYLANTTAMPPKTQRMLQKVRSQISTVPVKTYGDTLNILSIEQLRASIHFQLGIYLRFNKSVDGVPRSSDSIKHFKAALTTTNIGEGIYSGLQEGYQRINKTAASIVIDDIYLLRTFLQGGNNLLGSNVHLAQSYNQRNHTSHAITSTQQALVSTSAPQLALQLFHGENTTRARLVLADAYLRKRSASRDEYLANLHWAALAIAPLYDPTFSPDYTNSNEDKEKGAKALEIVTNVSAVLNVSPETEYLIGAIGLARARIRMNQFYLDEKNTDRTLVEGIIADLKGLIDGADQGKTPGQLHLPTDKDFPAGERANNGVFEDYELSSALQLRAEANITLRNYGLVENNPLADLKRSREVFVVVDDKSQTLPMNHYAEFTLANYLQSVASNTAKANEVMAAAVRDFPELNLDPAQLSEVSPEAKGIFTELLFLLRAEERLLVLQERLQSGLAPDHDALKQTITKTLASVQSRLFYIYRALIAKKEVPEKSDDPKVQAEIDLAKRNFDKIRKLAVPGNPISDVESVQIFSQAAGRNFETLQVALGTVLSEEDEEISTDAAQLRHQNAGISISDQEEMNAALSNYLSQTVVPQAQLLHLEREGIEVFTPEMQAALEDKFGEDMARILVQAPPFPNYPYAYTKASEHLYALKALADGLKNAAGMFIDLAGYDAASPEAERNNHLAELFLAQAQKLYDQVEADSAVIIKPAGEEIYQEAELAALDIPIMRAAAKMDPADNIKAIQDALGTLRTQINDRADETAQAELETVAAYPDDRKIALSEFPERARTALEELMKPANYKGQLVGRSRDAFYYKLADLYMQLGFLLRQKDGRESPDGNACIALARYVFEAVNKTERGDLAVTATVNNAWIRFVEGSDKVQRYLQVDGFAPLASTFAPEFRGQVKDVLEALFGEEYAEKASDSVMPLTLQQEFEVMWDDVFLKLPSATEALMVTGRDKYSNIMKLAQLFGRYGMIALQIDGKGSATAVEALKRAEEYMAIIRTCGIKEYEAEIQLLEFMIALVQANNTTETDELANIAVVIGRLEHFRLTDYVNLSARARDEYRLIAIQAYARYAFLYRNVNKGSKDNNLALFRIMGEINEGQAPTGLTELIDGTKDNKDEQAIYRAALALQLLPDVLSSPKKDTQAAGSLWLGQIAYVLAEDDQDMLDLAFERLSAAATSDEVRGNQYADVLSILSKIKIQSAGLRNESLAHLWPVITLAGEAEDRVNNSILLIRELQEQGKPIPVEISKVIGDLQAEYATLAAWAQWDSVKALRSARDARENLKAKDPAHPERETQLEVRYKIALAKTYLLEGELRRYKDPVFKDYDLAEQNFMTALDILAEPEPAPAIEDGRPRVNSVLRRTVYSQIYIALGRLYGEVTWDKYNLATAEEYWTKARTILEGIEGDRVWQAAHKQVARSLRQAMKEVAEATGNELAIETRLSFPDNGYNDQFLRLQGEYALFEGMLKVGGGLKLLRNPDEYYTDLFLFASLRAYTSTNISVTPSIKAGVQLRDTTFQQTAVSGNAYINALSGAVDYFASLSLVYGNGWDRLLPAFYTKVGFDPLKIIGLFFHGLADEKTLAGDSSFDSTPLVRSRLFSDLSVFPLAWFQDIRGTEVRHYPYGWISRLGAELATTVPFVGRDSATCGVQGIMAIAGDRVGPFRSYSTNDLVHRAPYGLGFWLQVDVAPLIDGIPSDSTLEAIGANSSIRLNLDLQFSKLETPVSDPAIIEAGAVWATHF